MDFDPSQFLAMAMSEDPNSSYTAPDLIQPPEHAIPVEGGLQMEQDIHIPVPLFGSLLSDNESYEMESPVEVEDVMIEPHIEINENMPTEPLDVGNTTPVDRTASPHPICKKIIPATFEETRFRKDFYVSIYERVKLFRLHCTICDKHLGCAPWLTERQMRTHKLLSVSVCRKCFEYYGDINFPIEEGSEIYCCWCGEGGEVFCCAKCPKTVCKKCIRRNFGERKIKEIDENDNWTCFVCNPTDIYPHRTMFWGLQRYSREMRQKVAFLEREEKQEKLSKDSSHCCLEGNSEYSPISLPPKVIMSKIPLCLIAGPHRVAVVSQPDHPHQRNFTVQNMNNNVRPQNNQLLLKTGGPACLQKYQNSQPSPYQSHPSQQMIYRSAINRSMSKVSPVQVNPPSLIQNSVGQVAQRSVSNRMDLTIPPNKQQMVYVIKTNKPQSSDHSLPSQANNSGINVDWLEKGMNDVSNTISVIKKMVDHYNSCRNELKEDVTKLSSFSDQFSHNIKIAICSLAKTNQNMLDARKVVFDDQVNSIVNSIKASVISAPVNHRPPTPQPSPPPVADTSQADEEMPSLNAALLCETVLEVEGNKENENSNRYLNPPVKRASSKPNSLQNGRMSLLNIRKRQMQRQSPKKSIQVINLVDDDDDEDNFDASYYLKKYKIKPCKVVLTRCK